MVYIDYQRNGWSHLVGDSIDELHLFAQSIGLKREWFQDKTFKPHYDVRGMSLYKKAIGKGAKAVTSKKIIEVLRITLQ